MDAQEAIKQAGSTLDLSIRRYVNFITHNYTFVYDGYETN